MKGGEALCLAVPAKVIEKEENQSLGLVEVGGARVKVNFSLLPSIKVGDYVLVHAGFAIGKILESEAKETLALWEEMQKY